MITHINPVGSMDLLSQLEVDRLKQTASSDIYQLFRNCSLAVLNSGSHTDSSKEILERFKSFDIHVIRRERGVKLELFNAPEHAFVDGEIIRGIQEHLFSVLRDILYVSNQLESNRLVNLTNSTHISNVVFAILRNAKVILPGADPNLIVCWGGHSINEIEYQYTRAVGSELGLRELNICTGCGPGAMEGPMKGAAVGHAKQRVRNGRYIGLTEPSIIAAEPPNPIVNELVILPDIEKRLEAFVRLGHGIIIFPGGVGTAEELLYLLGIMMHPANERQPMPIILPGSFIRCCLTKLSSSLSIRCISSLSPCSLKGPFFSMARMPPSLTLPATMPEKARRRLAASNWGGWLRCRSRLAMLA